MISCLPAQALAFLAVFVYAMHAIANDCVSMETGLYSMLAVAAVLRDVARGSGVRLGVCRGASIQN